MKQAFHCRNFSIRLALAAVAITLLNSAGAQPSATRVPLTSMQARDLGLDPALDGTLFRVLQKSGTPAPSGGTPLNYSISAREQRGASSEVFLQDTADGRWCESGSGNAFADITLNLPSASVVSAMRIWGFDQSASNDLTTSLIERCTPNNQSGSVITSVIAQLSSSTSAGNFFEAMSIASNNTIDNDACSYTLRTRYSTPGEANFCAGSTLRLQKIRLVYSPP